MIRAPRAVVWSCAIVLAAAFILTGLSKVEGPAALRWGERLAHWGYPAGARYVIGVLEVFGGLDVLIPRWRRPAAATLLVLMLGALGTHATWGEFPRLVPPFVLGGLALLVYTSPPQRRGA